MNTSPTKKLALYILSGFAVVLTSFFIAVQMPGDALDNLLLRQEKVSVSSSDYEIKKMGMAHRMGIDKPLFYFRLSSLAETGYEIYFATENKKDNYSNLLRKYGNSKEVYLFARKCQYADEVLDALNKKYNLSAIDKFSGNLQFIQKNSAATNMDSVWTMIEKDHSLTDFRSLTLILKQSWEKLSQQPHSYRAYTPAIAFSADNRFNDWFFGGPLSQGLIHFDLGTSFFTGEKITSLLKNKIAWSLGFSLTAIFIAFIIGIPLAAWIVYKKNKNLDKFIRLFAATGYAMPVYLVGVILLFLFSNPDLLNIFPSSGVKPIGLNDNVSIAGKLWASIPYLILPLICYTFSLLAFVVSTTGDLLRGQMLLPYIVTARAKGLDDKTIVYHHALKNVLPPLISLLANIFPAIIGGSVIIETLFSIPGMGNEIVRACLSRNFPLLSAIILISGFATIVMYALVDIAVYRLDPRIKSSAA